jgi:hypothetical protein
MVLFSADPHRSHKFWSTKFARSVGNLNFINLHPQHLSMSFNLFGNKEKDQPRGIFTDKTYVSSSAKMNGCAELAKNDPATVFITWFPETTRKFKEFFSQHDIAENRIIEARQVHGALLTGKTAVFAEHYPMHGKEIELVQNWAQDHFIVFSSMDEPLFKHFGSEKMIPLMKLLGMKEEESIEHSFVSKSIIKGQNKIAAQVVVEQTADSQERWMEINIKRNL